MLYYIYLFYETRSIDSVRLSIVSSIDLSESCGDYIRNRMTE